MFEVPDYEEEKLIINIMDGMLDDKTISEDIICIVNIETDKILEWIDRHKWENHINYKGKEYKGKDTYPNVFIFEERNVLEDRLIIKIDDIDYKYREIFYA